MLYYSDLETAPTLPDIQDVSERFLREYDSDVYEKKISRLIRRVVDRVRKQQSEEFQAWVQAVRRLRNEDRYVDVMIDQARLGSMFRPRPSANLLKRWSAGAAVAVLFSGVVWFVYIRAPNPADPRNFPLGFAIWAVALCSALVLSALRLLLGARKFDEISGRVMDWFSGDSKPTKKSR
jgi:hypothetical protein